MFLDRQYNTAVFLSRCGTGREVSGTQPRSPGAPQSWTGWTWRSARQSGCRLSQPRWSVQALEWLPPCTRVGTGEEVPKRLGERGNSHCERFNSPAAPQPGPHHLVLSRPVPAKFIANGGICGRARFRKLPTSEIRRDLAQRFALQTIHGTCFLRLSTVPTPGQRRWAARYCFGEARGSPLPLAEAASARPLACSGLARTLGWGHFQPCL